MAPFEGLTAVKVYKAAGIFLVVTTLVNGILSLYLGLTHPPDDVLFGIEGDIWAGLVWLFSAIVWTYLFRRVVRQEASLDE